MNLLPWSASGSNHLVLFGEMADLVEKALTSAGRGAYTLIKCASLREAVQAAARIVESSQSGGFQPVLYLLSPGGTSFDEFRDFEERGEAFRKWVSELMMENVI